MKRRPSDRRNARGRVRRAVCPTRVEALENRQLLATLIVNSALDNDSRDAVLTLREALLVANDALDFAALSAQEQAQVTGTVTAGAADDVTFDLGAGAQQIRLLSPLPTVTSAGGAVRVAGPVDLAGVPTLSLVPDSAGASSVGLVFQAGDSSVRNLILNSFTGAAITFQSAASGQGNANFVTNSIIGTDAAGAAGLGNGIGIRILSSSGNTIGGNTPALRNIISGNLVGIDIGSTPAISSSANLIQGNFIGTTPAGDAARGNSVAGIRIQGSGNNAIGGTAAGVGNLISGNGVGVLLDGSGTTVPTVNNRIQGNRIGTDLLGTTAVANGTGIRAVQASTQVGGSTVPERNIIAGNLNDGVRIEGLASGGTAIVGNFIGLGADAATPLGNGGAGVALVTATGVTVGSTIPNAGNVIVRSGSHGVRIADSAPSGANNLVIGNSIGTDPAGTAGLGNLGHGVSIEDSTNNAIGSNLIGAGNVIADNALAGVSITSTTPATLSQNLIQGNLIGLTLAGDALGNGTAGVVISDSSANVIGGSTAARNVISGNVEAGIRVVGDGTANRIQSNFIGTNASGDAAVPNGVGIQVGSGGTIIGGTAGGAGNVISGNAGPAILLSDALGGVPDGNTIQGNRIGLAAATAAAVPNAGDGIRILGGQGNLVGGVSVGSGNAIANNVKGVVVVNGTRQSSGNSILGNEVGPNAGIGIDLGDDGPTANGSDNPAGPNGFQSDPVVDSALIRTLSTTIEYTVAAPSAGGYRVEFFLSGVAGGREGRVFLGADTVAPNASGSFTLELPTRLPLGAFLTATLTDLSTDNTSEYSPATVVDDLSDLAISIDPLPTGVVLGSQFTYTITVTNNGISPATDVTIQSAITAALGTIQSAQSSLGTATFDAAAGTVTATIPSLNVGSSVSLTVVVRPDAVGDLAISGSVSAATDDPDLSNNALAGGIAVAIAPAIDLVLGAVATPAVTPAGTTSTFTFTIQNTGPSPASGVVFTTSAMAAEGEFVAAGSTQGLQFLGDRTFRYDLPGTLAPGASATVTIVVRGLPPTNPQAPNTLVTLVGSVVGTEAEPDTSDNTASATLTIAAAADLRLTTVAETDPVVITRPLVILVTVTNDGPSDAENVLARTTLPAGLTFVPFDPNATGPTSDPLATFNGSEVSAQRLTPLAAGETWTYRIVVIPTVAETLVVETTVQSAAAELDPLDNFATLTTLGGDPVAARPLADLSLSVVDRPDPVTAGQPLTYTVLIQNQGPSTAPNARLVNVLPAGAILDGVSPSQGSFSYDPATNTVVVDLGDVGLGSQPTVQFFVRPQAAGSIVNTASISSDAIDDIGANTVVTTTDVLPSSDLAVTAAVASPALIGQPATFTITVVNNGPSPADAVVLTNNLPAGLAPVGAPAVSQGTASVASGVITAAFGLLAPGAQATLTFTVVPPALGTITNTAAVQSAASDLVPSNNAVTTLLDVVPAANLALVVSPLPGTVRRGVNLPVTMTVTNNGPSTARNVRVESLLPPNMGFVSGSASKGVVGLVGGTAVGQVGDLAPGESVSLNFTLVPELAGSYTLTFAVGSTTADPVAADNVATVTTTAEGEVGRVQLAANAFAVDEGAGVATITVVRVGGDAGAVTVQYVVTPSSAQAGTDFQPVGGTLRFEDGETSKTFTVPIVDNQIPQGDRMAVISLLNPGLGTTLGDPSQVGLVIQDNDANLLPGPQVTSIRRVGRGRSASVEVAFNAPIDPGTASNLANYQIVSAGRDGRLGTGDDRAVPLASATYNAATQTVTLRAAGRASLDPALQLTINGDTPGALTSAQTGTRLDGDANGRQGGNFVGRIVPLTTVFDPRFYEIYRRFLGQRREAAQARIRMFRRG